MSGNTGRRRNALLSAVLLVAAVVVPAQAERPPQIAIIIDDMGDRKSLGWEALRLPGPVAYAFLPDTPHGAEQARAAHRDGKEVLLHLPMDPVDAPAHPTSISTRDDRDTVRARLMGALQGLPFAVGVNNHQGSEVTRSEPHMRWLMTEIRRHPLYFIDSRTAGGSLAYRTARTAHIPASRRDVFLDTDPDGAAVAEQFFRLVQKAKRQGTALAIGHPYPSTLRVLGRELQQLPAHGVELVSPSTLIRRQLGQPDTPQGRGGLQLTASDRLESRATARGPRTANSATAPR